MANKQSEYTLKGKIWYTLIIMGKVYLSIFIFLLFYELIINKIFFDIITDDLPNNSSVNKPIWRKFFSALILAPIIEEYLFRAPIKKIIYFWILGLLVTILAIISIVLKNQIHYLILLVYGIYLLLIYFFNYKRVGDFGLNIIILNILITSLVFGFFHIRDFEDFDVSKNWLLYLKKSIPMVILGLGLARIRLKYNTYWSMIGHLMFNSVPSLVLLLK